MKTNIDFKKLEVVIRQDGDEYHCMFRVPQEWRDIVNDESKPYYMLPLIVRSRNADGGYYYHTTTISRNDSDLRSFTILDPKSYWSDDQPVLEYYQNGGTVEVGVIDYEPGDFMSNGLEDDE